MHASPCTVQQRYMEASAPCAAYIGCMACESVVPAQTRKCICCMTGRIQYCMQQQVVRDCALFDLLFGLQNLLGNELSILNARPNKVNHASHINALKGLF